jgi:hypothetical protein
MPPGTYTVKVVLDGRDVSQPQTVTVKKDPNSSGSEADIQAQTKLLMEVRDNMSLATDLINEAESIRAQLARLKDLASDDDPGKALKASADNLDKTVVGVESHLFNMTATGRGQDQLRLPSQIVEKLSHLADIVSLNDFPPTEQALQVHAKLTGELGEYRDKLKQIVATDVAAFNATLRQGNLGAIVVGR